MEKLTKRDHKTMDKSYRISKNIYENEKGYFIISNKTDKKLVFFPLYQKDQMHTFFNKLNKNI